MGRASNLPRELLVIRTFVLKLSQEQVVLKCVLDCLGPCQVDLPLKLLGIRLLVFHGRVDVRQGLMIESLRAFFEHLPANQRRLRHLGHALAEGILVQGALNLRQKNVTRLSTRADELAALAHLVCCGGVRRWHARHTDPRLIVDESRVDAVNLALDLGSLVRQPVNLLLLFSEVCRRKEHGRGLDGGKAS